MLRKRSIRSDVRAVMVKAALVFAIFCSGPVVAGTEWSVVEGDHANVSAKDGALTTGGLERGRHAQALVEPVFADGVVEATFQLKPGLQNYGLVGRADGEGTFYTARVFSRGEKFLIARNEGGSETVLDSIDLPEALDTGALVIRLEMRGPHLTASVRRAGTQNEEGTTLQVTDVQIASGRSGVRVRSHFPAGAAIWESFSIEGKQVPFRLGAEPLEKVASDVLFRQEVSLGSPVLDLTKEAWTLTNQKGESSPIRVDRSLLAQGHPAGEYVYALELAPERISQDDELFLLELGPISQADVVSINGHVIGSYGEFPPPFVKAHIAQEIARRYVIPASWLHRDRLNRIEVKVATGTIGGTLWYAGGGIFQGPVRLSPLRQSALVDFSLRSPDGPSVLPLLSDASYLNRFLQRENLDLRLRVASLDPSQPASDVELIVRLMPAGAPGARPPVVERRLALQPGFWSQWEAMSLPMPPPGAHTCEVVVRAGSSILFQKEIPFVVESGFPSLSLPAGLNVTQASADLRWQNISSRTVGSFGARFANARNVLDPADWTHDVRGTLSAVVHLSKDEARPMLLFPGVQQPPLTPYTPADYQEFPLGRNYDGFNDAWPFGFIRIGAASGGGCSFHEADWVSRSYLFRDGQGADLGQLLLSKLSPAMRLTVRASSATFFEDLPKWGLKSPSWMAYASAQGVKVVPGGQTIEGAMMTENWLLIWFHGSEGWGDFDVPWLFVLERKPDCVALSPAGLSFSQSKGRALGTIYAMPLYGVRLLDPALTAHWQEGLDAETLANVRRWSQTLSAFPVGIDRSVAIDLRKDDVFLRERVRFENRPDDWGTSLRQVTPVSPVMALGMHSENLSISASADLQDFNLVTTYGPLLGAEGADQVVYRISGLLRYVVEAPVLVDDAGESEKVKEARKILGDTMGKLVGDNNLKDHPWPWSIWRGKFTPGYVQFEYSSILNSLPYLDDPLRGQLKTMLRDEVSKVFLPRTLERDAVAVGSWKPVFGQDLYRDIHEPLTGRSLIVLSDHLDRRAIDTPFWQSFQIYTIWQAAHYLENWEIVEGVWDQVAGLAELPVHSHDWATLQSWDFFSGYRIGNGIQESGGMFAGYAGMARMAHRLGLSDERDFRAGLAVLQLVGMNVANTGIEYVRFHRPWSGRNSEAKNIARAEKMFPSRYIEYNEFTGSPVQAILLPWQPLFNNSYIHDLLPEVMRVYPEIWPKENAAFFRGAAYDPPIDMVVRMERADMERIERVYQNQVKSPKMLERLMAARAFLESSGSMRWEPVIAEDKKEKSTHE